MEMSKDMPPAEYPQSNNNCAMQDPLVCPPQPPPPTHDAQQYPAVVPQPAAIQVAIQRQPAVVTSHYQPWSDVKVREMVYRLSIVTVLFGALLSWILLIFAIPALVFSIMSINRANRGEYETARIYYTVALILNILAFVLLFVSIIICFVVIPVILL